MRRSHACRPTATAVLALVLALAAVAPPAQASFVSKVTVTSRELHNGECLDQVLFCLKPDLFARAWLVNADGTQVRCPDGPVSHGFDNIIEDQVLCSGVAVEGNFKVRFEMWDKDGTPPNEADQQGDLAAGAEKGWTTPFFFWPGLRTSQTYTTSGGPSWAVFTVDVEPAPTTITLASSGLSFAPSLGERVFIAGSLTFPSRLRITVDTPGGAVLVVEGPFRKIFNVDWDGRGPDGKVLPEGNYDFHVVDVSAEPGTTPPSASGFIHIEVPTTRRVSLKQVLPVTPWDFWAGPLTVIGSASEAGSFTLTASSGTCSSPSGPRRTIGPVTRAAGLFEIDWDGLDDTGAIAAAGSWCLSLTGENAQGSFPPASTPILVKPRSAGLEVIASLAPIAPAFAPGVTPIIRASVVDTAHQDRFAYSLSLIVAPAPVTGSSMPFAPITVGSCTRASTCSWPIPPALLTGTALVWSVTAAEAPGLPDPALLTATTGLRITDLVVRPSIATRVDVPAVVTDSSVSQAPVTTTIDVAYYPGTGLDPDDPAGGSRFSYAIEKNVNEIRGFGGRDVLRFPSSLVSNWANVAIWAVREPVTVSANSSSDTCTWSGLDAVSFAGGGGVLHDVDCRDNAPGRAFSAWVQAGTGSVGWHELHHAVYDESDEYCCDGGYADGVNLYNSEASCMDKGSDPTTCAMITKLDAMGNQIDSRPWWRSDVGNPDVMVFNRIENADDRRAAENTFARCRRGGC